MKALRIFISSPGDVELERQIARRVIQHLQNELADTVLLEPYFWEYEPMRVTKDYPSQIPRPSEFDIVVCILWSRLGTPLGPQHRRPDGTTYRSGTEFEFEDAAASFAQRGTPDLLIYRNRSEPAIRARPKEERERQLAQLDALDTFLERWTRQGEIITGALTSYADLAKFEELLGEHLRKLILLRHPPGAEPSVRRANWTTGSPFRGLEAFEFEHAPIFRGRTRAIQEVITLVRRQHLARQAWIASEPASKAPPTFVLVSAMSGIGKSSLVRAGVLPLLTAPGVIEGVSLWRRAILKPGGTSQGLFSVLAAALTDADALPELLSDGTSPERVANLLRNDPSGAEVLIKGGLSQAAARLLFEEEVQLREWEAQFRAQGRAADAERCSAQRTALKQSGAALVLFADQLEELFTAADQTPRQERDAFLTAIDALARSGRVVVLATLRSDFFARASESPIAAALINEGALHQLEPPTAVELAQIIRDPAAEAGLAFEEDPETGSRLDDVLLAATRADPAALPLLEFTLEQLYQLRSASGLLTHAAYRELNGVEGALALRAEEEFAGLGAGAETAFGRVFGVLVNLSEIRDEERPVRRRAKVGDLSSEADVQSFVSRFAGARLLVLDQIGTAPTVSVVHEALFSHWARLKDWIDKNRDLLRIRGRIETAAARWMAENRPHDLLLPDGRLLAEAQELLKHVELLPANAPLRPYINESVTAQRKRRRRRLAAVAAAAAGVSIAGVVSWYEWQAAGRNRVDAKLFEYRLALRQAQSAFLSNGDDADGTRKALDAAQRVFSLSQEITQMRGQPAESAAEDAARIYQITAIERAELGDSEGAVQDWQSRNALLEKMSPQARAAAAQGPMAGQMDTATLNVFHLRVDLFVSNYFLQALQAQNELLKEALRDKLRGENGDTQAAKQFEADPNIRPATEAEIAETLSKFDHFSQLFELLLQEFPTPDNFELLVEIEKFHGESLEQVKKPDQAQGVYEDMVKTAQRYLQWESAQTSDSPRSTATKGAASTLADAQQALAAFYLRTKAFEKAILQAQQGLQTLESQRGLEDAEDQRTTTRGILVQALLATGDKAKGLREAELGESHRIDFSRGQLQAAWGQTLKGYHEVEESWQKIGQYDRAAKTAEESLELIQRDLSLQAGTAVPADLEDAYVRLSWDQLIARQFVNAEATARKGLVSSTAEEDQAELDTNLAHALLFQDRVDEAIAIYDKWKSKRIAKDHLFASAVLDDLRHFGELGLDHPALPRVTALMQEALNAGQKADGAPADK